MSIRTVRFTNPSTGEKFVHIEKPNGNTEFLYGPKDTSTEKNHGHAVFGADRRVVFNRDPKP